MGYDPNIHSHKSIRLNGYDYSQGGMYYVTICTRDRRPFLSKIETNGGAGLASALDDAVTPTLSRIGEIIDRHWNAIPNKYPHVVLDEYVIMPNHIHGILIMHSDLMRIPSTSRATARVAPPLHLGSIL